MANSLTTTMKTIINPERLAPKTTKIIKHSKPMHIKRVIGHINTVANINHNGTIYRAQNPYTPYFYSQSDLRISNKRGFRLSMNDIVEFSIDRIGDRHYARNITSVNGKAFESFIIYPKQFINYWSLSIKSSQTNRNENDDRIRASTVIHPKQRTIGIVISAMNEGGFGWILVNVANSLPIRYHFTQIQATGIKKLALHSRVEFNVIKGRDHDWSFYISKPGGNLLTYEKADVYGQWLRSLERYPTQIHYASDCQIHEGFVCEYSLLKQTGFITPFDALHKRYLFHIDNVQTAKCENRRVFINDEVRFEINGNIAINITSLTHSDGAIRGKHWNWNKVLPFERKYAFSSHYRRSCVEKLDENKRYFGLIEFNAYELADKYLAKIYFDSLNEYPRTLRVPLRGLQCTDIKYVRRGTRVEFSVDIDRQKGIICGVKNITAPRGRLLTFLSGERGEFYRWRNVNCAQRLNSILDDDDCSSNDLLIGFVRNLDVKIGCGVIEIVSKSACYEPVLFWFDDVLFADNVRMRHVKLSSVVQFNVTFNEYSYFYSNVAMVAKRNENDGYQWNEDPRTWLTAKAINISSLDNDEYLSQSPPMFKMKHVECILDE